MKTLTTIRRRLLKIFLGGIFALAAGPAFTFAKDLPPEWKYFQTLQVGETGLVKMTLPAESYSASRAQGEDIRLLDESGKEIPYVLDFSSPVKMEHRQVRDLKTSLESEATKVSIQTGVGETITALILETPASDFFKSVLVEGSTDGSSWTTLRDGAPIFQQNGVRELRIPLTPGVWPFLRVSIDDRRTAPIAVTRAELELAAANTPTDSVSVKIEERNELDGKTVLRLRFPFLHMNLSELVLETPDPFFQRKASLSELRYQNGEVSPVSLGEDQFYRLPQASKTTLAFSGPLLASATLVIENGDNAPLSISAVRALYRRAFLVAYFEKTGAYRLISGNPLAAAARYDLASLGAELKKARALFPKVGNLEVNAAFAAAGEFQDIPAQGSALKTKAWSYRKSVTAKPGVAEILLDEECLSHAEKSLADLRLVASNRQIPFLLVRHSGIKKIILPIQTATDAKRPSLSRWELALPKRGLPISRLSLQVNESKNPYFERQIRLFEKRLDARETTREWTLTTAFWKRSPGQKAAPLNLVLSEPPETEKLFVETDNGDNQPLELVSASATYDVSSIVFRSEGQETFLYYGNDDASAPRYDLELASLRLLQAEKIRPILGSEEPLKAERSGIRLGGKSGWIFWAALVIVVAGLLFVLARLLPKPN